VVPFLRQCAIFTSMSFGVSNLYFSYLQTHIVDSYSANPLKHSASRHAAALEHIILNLSQTLILIDTACLAVKQSLVWRNRDLNPWSTALEASTLTNYFTTDVVKVYGTLHPTSSSSFNDTLFSSFWKNLNILCTNPIILLLYFVNFKLPFKTFPSI